MGHCHSNITNSGETYERRASRIHQILHLVEDPNKAPPEGLEFSFTSSTANQTHTNAAEFCIDDVHDWELLIAAGLTWKCLINYIEQRECVQIGSLFLSKTILCKSTFEEIISLGDIDDGQARVQYSRKLREQQPNKWYNTEMFDKVLSGLAKLCKTTPAGKCQCHVSKQASLKVWELSFDWGVTFDKIYFYSSFDASDHAMKGIFKNFRHVHFRRISYTTGYSLPAILMEESSIEGIHGLSIYGSKVEWFSTILRQTTKIQVLKLEMSLVDPHQMVTFVQTLRECSSLNAVTLECVSAIPPPEWVSHLASLIRCNNLRSIGYLFHTNLDEISITESTEVASRKLDRTNAILNAIESNKNLLRLTLHGNHSFVNTMESVDKRRIESVVESRRRNLYIAKTCRFMGSNHPLKMAIYGKVICECASGDRELSLGSTLFEILCQTSQYLV